MEIVSGDREIGNMELRKIVRMVQVLLLLCCLPEAFLFTLQ